jgi:hypothetical protein
MNKKMLKLSLLAALAINMVGCGTEGSATVTLDGKTYDAGYNASTNGLGLSGSVQSGTNITGGAVDIQK